MVGRLAIFFLVAIGLITTSHSGDSRPAGRRVTVGAGIVPARVLVEPTDGATPLVRAIDKAARSIFVEIYILSDRRILHALERAEAQKVRVYVLLEHHPLGMGAQPERVRDELMAAGVAVRWTPRRFQLTHAKLLVLDDREAVFSTANLSKSAFTRNREVLVFDRASPDVRTASNIFRRDWDRSVGLDPDANVVVAPDNARSRLLHLVRTARRQLDVYAEEVNDPRVEASLEAAVRRQVNVRVIVSTSPGPGASRLARAGVAVRRLRQPYVHAKVILVDGREAFIGSENLSSASLDKNREVGVLVRGSSLVRLAHVFTRDWARSGELP